MRRFLASCLAGFLAGHMLNYSLIFLGQIWFSSHSMSALGYGLSFGLPAIFSWFAAGLCSKYTPERVILFSQGGFFLAAILLIVGHYLWQDVKLQLFIVAAACNGIAWSLVAPARFTAVSRYCKEHQLKRATIALNLLVMVGFGLSPYFVKTLEFSFGWFAVWFATVVLVAFSSLAIVFAKPAELNEDKNKLTSGVKSNLKSNSRNAGNNSQLQRLKLAFITSPALWPLFSLAILSYVLMGPMQIVLPYVAQEHLALSAHNQGLYLSLVALGLVVGGLLALSSKHLFAHGVNTTLSLIGACSLLIATVFVQPVLFNAFVLFLAGVLGGFALSHIVSEIQTCSPEVQRPNVMALYTMISQVIPALSGLLVGLLAEQFSPKTALVAVVSAAIAIISIVHLLPNLFSITNSSRTNRTETKSSKNKELKG